MDIGKKISVLRKKNNMSQQDLANRLNVSNKTISKWECGYSIPDIETLNLLSQIFNISLDELVNCNKEKENIEIHNDTKEIKKNYKKIGIVTIVGVICVLIVLIPILCVSLIPKTPNIESSDVFEINEEKSLISCSVSNNTENFSFNDAFKIADNNSWELYYDITGTLEINSKTVPLEIGDNTFYVLIENKSGKKKVYTVVIRRRPMYSVNFYTDGGTAIQNQIIEENQFAVRPTQIPTKTGYTFVDWEFDFTNPITHTTTIHAKYSANDYKIIYHYENDTVEQYIKFDSQVTLKGVDTFNKEFYYIENWNTQKDGLGYKYNCGSSFKYSITNDLELYTIWKPIMYKITYQLNGGLNEKNPTTYNIESNTFVLEDPTRQGFDFDGWYTDSKFTNKTNQISSGSTGDLILYAKWNAIYNIKDNAIISLTNYGKRLTNFIVPSSIDGMLINKIEKDAFRKCENLTSIELPASITYIGDYAFAECNELEHITLPINLTIINKGVFLNCTNLTKITIPEKVYSIKAEAFNGCSNLTVFLVLGWLNSNLVEDNAFSNTDNLNVYFYHFHGDQEHFTFTNKFHHIIKYFSYSEPSNNRYIYWHYKNGNIEIWDVK